MTKYSFVLLSGQQEGLLEQLQVLGLVDITRTAKAMDDTSSALASDIELIDGLIKGIQGLEIPEGTTPVPYPEKDLVRLAGGVLALYTQSREQIAALEKECTILHNWGAFDTRKLEQLSAVGVNLHFHILSAKQFKEEWASTYALSELSRDKGQVYFVVAGEDDLPGKVPAPTRDYRAASQELEKTKEKLEKELYGQVAYMKEQLPQLEAMRQEAYSSLDLYLASQAAVEAAEGTLVTLVGYAPKESDAAVTAALDATGVLYLKDEAKVQDNPPISFKNNWFVRQFEVLTDMYGRPAYDGFDPTPYIAVFFLLFFAFCMGDCGYGIILLLAGLAMGKSEGTKSLSSIVTLLGIGTIVIGFFFHTFFSMDMAEWPIFKGFPFLPAKIAGYDGTMVMALVVGIVHLCLAMVLKTVYATKNNGFLNSLGTWGWTLLIVGGVVVGGFSLMGVLDKDITKWLIIVLGVVSAAGIFLLNDIHRNPLINIGSGLWETYNTVTGLLGDVLSYLRLYALGLAGAMLGKAFNDIGLMVLGDGSNYALWLPFLLIVVIGHTLNLAMCALGAFVHPLRLNFLEFFKNSGYQAAGRNYNPLKR